MNAHTKNGLRMLLVIVFGLGTVLMGYVTLMAPMIASTGPAILTVGFAAVTYLLWRSPAKPSPEQVAYDEQLRLSRVTPQNPSGIWPPPPPAR